MTIAAATPGATSDGGDATPVPTPEGHVALTVDGFSVVVPEGTLVIRAAERLGIAIPRFCDHPLLDPVGACRQCIVEIEGQRKPVASCTIPVTEGMVVRTQLTSAVAEKAQAGTMEMLLINHPLDCPVCDKGGECPLQNQSMANGAATSRFVERKRTYPKPLRISSQVLLDRERCVLCARCTRFSAQIAGDPFIELFERGALEQVGIYGGGEGESAEPFQSYFSGNTIQICPVGALTGASYRFHARPFDLLSVPSGCEHCASGCAQRADVRRGAVQRRLAAPDPEVNEEWSCDKGRWAFTWSQLADRLTGPLVRDESGELVGGSWTGALELAGRRLGEGRAAAVIAGGRLSLEGSYALAKLARAVLGTGDVDGRARPHSAEEADFLASTVVGVTPATGGLSYAALETAPVVVLAGLEPEEESPIVALRLRKASLAGTRVVVLQAFATPSVTKAGAELVITRPGEEASVLRAALAAGAEASALAAALATDGAVLLVGERLAEVSGALSAVAAAAARGVRVGWVPRRAGERGALEAGLLPTLLPGGRPAADPAAHDEVAAAWGVPSARWPSGVGRDVTAILEAVLEGDVDTLVVAGLDVDDLPDPRLARRALAAARTTIVLDVRRTATAELADVVLAVAPPEERGGTLLSWEGRPRTSPASLETGGLSDTRVAHLLAAELGVDLGLPHEAAARLELARLGSWAGARPTAPDVAPATVLEPGPGEAALATWHHLLDDGLLQDGEPHLAGTRRTPVARVSAATAAAVGAVGGGWLTVSTGRGSITLPLAVTEMADGVVWVPTHSTGSHVRSALVAGSGDVVAISRAEAPAQQEVQA